MFAAAGFESSVAPSLKQGRWQKLMWNIPFSTLAVTAGGVTTDRILADPGLNRLARTLIIETGTAANADGCSIDIAATETRMMANTATMGAYRPSMLVDYESKSPLEVESILGGPPGRYYRWREDLVLSVISDGGINVRQEDWVADDFAGRRG
jgi:2-dehydropantoate 2-reductase